MFDQADRLRLLMRGAGRASEDDGAPQPRALVFVGAKGGVGTTTLAVNFAVGLAQQGRRTLLVDGDLGKCDAAALCGIREVYSLGDVLARRRSVQEALCLGPGRIQVLPGAWAPAHITDCDPVALDRLLAEVSRLRNVDYVVIDAGCGVNRIVERFWKAADRVVLVTTADGAALLDAYAALKSVGRCHTAVPAQVVMNKVSEGDAHVALCRLATASRRFLQMELACLATIPDSHDIIAAARRAMPFVLSSPYCQAAQIVNKLVETELKGSQFEKSNQLIHVVHG